MFKKILLIWIFIFGTVLSAQDYSVTNIPESLKKNAKIVIRNSESEYNIKAIDEIEVYENATITILNKTGDDYSKLSIHYDKETKINDIKVNILDANGKSIKTFSKKDFSDYSSTPSFGLYVDDRVLILNPVATQYPYTIQYSYKIISKNTAFISDFLPRGDFNIAVQNSKRIFKNASGIKLRYKIHDTEFGKVQKNGDDYISEFSYSNLIALNNEKYSPSIDYLDPKVEFALEKFSLVGNQGSITNWSEFGKWYYTNLLNPSTNISAELKNEVNSLGLTGSTEEKVKKLYQYMQQKTRYVLVAMGIGGWKPMDTEEVRKKGYGDCKGLTNYMRSLLLAANIPSYYSVIKSDLSSQTFDPDFPKMGGNHVILMVPTDNGNIWLENTSQTIAYNHLSYNTTNRNVLAISEKGIELINTPTYPSEKSQEIIKAKIKVKPDNGIDAIAELSYTGGQYDFLMPLVYQNQKEQKETIKEKFSYLKINNLTINDFYNDRDIAKLSYKLNFDAKEFSKNIGNDIFFRVIPFLNTNYLENDDERFLPFETPFAYQDIYEIEFEFPVGYKLSEIPKGEKIDSEFGNYTIDFKLNGEKLWVKRVLTINKGIYPKEKFSKYTEFRKKTANFDNIKILSTKL